MPILREYRTVARRTGVYSTRSHRSCIAWLPAGTDLLASPPDQSGWVAIDYGNCFVPEESLQRLSKPRRFSRPIRLPRDAILTHATSETDRNRLLVTIPRVREVGVHAAPSQSRAASMPPKQPWAHASRQTPHPQLPPRSPASLLPSPLSPPPRRKKAECTPPPLCKKAECPPAPQRISAGLATRSATAESSAGDPPVFAGRSWAAPGLLPKSEPVLVETAPTRSNVQLPHEKMESWHAMPSGGFVAMHVGA